MESKSPKINNDNNQINQEENLEQKKQYLTTEIINKNYNVNDFINYCQKKKENGDDLINWTLEELKQCVSDFQVEQQKKNNSETKNKSSMKNFLFSNNNAENNNNINNNINNINSQNYIQSINENIQSTNFETQNMALTPFFIIMGTAVPNDYTFF